MAKNSRRALSAKADSSGSSGIVLTMDMISTDDYGVMYTVPVRVGSSQQNFSLQVDTGSSDLWFASKSCSTASCSGTDGRLYDPSSSEAAGANFSIQYLTGTVNGPIVWDQLQIGGYTIPRQALASATTVDDEPLSYNFNGVLGLALPSDSLILQTIPTSTGGTPDGSTFSSNIFSLEQAGDAPSDPFFSLTLARPGSNQIPSLLGIGHHPPEIVSDPSQIHYSPIINGSAGGHFWKTAVRAITVYVNGQARPIVLESLSGAAEPTALLDSGVPLIITTPALANGIYGALGIGPAPDDYVPCATPLNLTITLDGQEELTLHPLDLTAEPAGQSASQYCTGLIQTDPSQLTATSDIGDMILGVPFMRNVYTVLAYQQPSASENSHSVQSRTYPMLGLFGLTNATQAMEEFDQVRVAKQPLGNGSSQHNLDSLDSGSKLSIGIKILIGLVGFFVLSLALFILRCVLARRRWQNTLANGRAEEGSNRKVEFGAYRAMGNKSRSSGQGGLKFGAHGSKRYDTPTELEMCDPWDPHAGTWRDTIIGTDAGESASLTSSYFPPPELTDLSPSSPLASPELMSGLLHDRDDSQTSYLATGMVGIGTAARGSIIDADLQYERRSHDSSRSSLPLRPTASSRSSYTLSRMPTNTPYDID